MNNQRTRQEQTMRSVDLTHAKAHLSELVEQAASGDPVRITRRGKPVAQITAVETPRRRIDPSALGALTDAIPLPRETVQDLVLWMRDEDRY